MDLPSLFSSLSRWRWWFALITILAMWSSHHRLAVDGIGATRLRAQVLPRYYRCVGLLSSKVNKKFFYFALWVSTDEFNVIRSMLKLALVLPVANVVEQHAVFEEPHVFYVCLSVSHQSCVESVVGHQIAWLHENHLATPSSQTWCAC